MISSVFPSILVGVDSGVQLSGHHGACEEIDVFGQGEQAVAKSVHHLVGHDLFSGQFVQHGSEVAVGIGGQNTEDLEDVVDMEAYSEVDALGNLLVDADVLFRIEIGLNIAGLLAFRHVVHSDDEMIERIDAAIQTVLDLVEIGRDRYL